MIFNLFKLIEISTNQFNLTLHSHKQKSWLFCKWLFYFQVLSLFITLCGDGCLFPSDTSSNLAANLKQELQTSDHLDANVMAYLRYRGIIPDIMESMKEKEILSPQMKVTYD